MKSCILHRANYLYCGDLEDKVCPNHWDSCCPVVTWGSPGLLSRGLGAGAYCPLLSTSGSQGSPVTFLRAPLLLEERIFPSLLWIRYPVEPLHCSLQGEPTGSQGHLADPTPVLSLSQKK